MKAAWWDLTVPVDASASSRRGVDCAIDLGLRGATLHFCSVVDATSACLDGATGALIDPAPLIRIMNEDAQATCDRAVNAARSNGIAADGKVVFGAIIPAISRFARERASNALVIGTHARTGASRTFLGSIAESLMQTAEVPVVVADTDDLEEDGPIMVAVDGTPAARAALHVALDLARAQKRTLSIINVVKHGRKHWLAAEPVLSEAADAARAANIAFELITMAGPPADSIIASARQEHSPMIVIGTSGRSDLARLVLGSVAASVVERAHVPVTVVRGR